MAFTLDTEARGLLPFYAILVQLHTFTVLRQNALTFTLPPPYARPPIAGPAGPAGWNSQRHTSHMVHSRLPDKGYITLTHSLRLKITSNALYYAKAKETRARTRDAAASRRTDDRRDRRAQQSANASGRFAC